MASASSSPGLDLHGSHYGPGRHICRIHVTTDLNRGRIDLVNHVVVGAEAGPVLFVASTLHGGEWISIEVVRRIVERLDPDRMAGSVIALPVANPTALGQLTRSTPDESDNADLNRVFPGGEAWITEQLAATITNEILPHVSALIDFHYGSWGSTFGRVSYGKDFPDPDVAQTSRAMALAFDYPLVRAQTTQRFPGPGSMVGYAGTHLGIPGIIGGVGGAGFEADQEEAWLEANVAGVMNVMRQLGILGEPVERGRILEFSSMERVNPTIGGFLYPSRDDDELGREVASGEILATVVSPYTRETLETLTAPCNGYLMYHPRWYPVRPGDWAYGVIPKRHEGTMWVEPDGSTVRP
jgi:uncharacterized protein